MYSVIIYISRCLLIADSGIFCREMDDVFFFKYMLTNAVCLLTTCAVCGKIIIYNYEYNGLWMDWIHT